MEMNEKQLIELHILLDRLFENESTEKDILTIQTIIQNNPAMLRYYFRCVELKSGLHQLKSLDTVCSPLGQNYDDMFWELVNMKPLRLLLCRGPSRPHRPK